MFSFPLSTPLNKSTTEIQNLPDFYGVSSDNHHCLSMSTATYLSCTGGNDIKKCTGPLDIRLLKPNSCISSIYMDNPTAVTQFCQISLSLNLPPPTLIQYDSHLILSSFPASTITCPNMLIRELEACTQVCVILAPCDCTLKSKTGDFELDTTICADKISDVVQYFGSNLLFLVSYYSHKISDTWPNFYGHTLFPTPIIDQLPSIPSSFVTNMHDALADTDRHYSDEMNTLIDQVQSDTAALSHTLTLPKTIFYQRSATDLCSIFALCLSFASLALSGYLFWRLTRMAKMLLILQARMDRVIGASLHVLPSLPDMPQSTTELSNDNSHVSHDMGFSTSALLWILSVILVIGLLYLCYYYWFQTHTRVSLLVYKSKTKYCYVDLFNLTTSLHSLTFSGSNVVKRVRMISKTCALRFLLIDWNDIKITFNGVNLILPNKYWISPLTFRKLQSIISQDFCSLLLIYQNSILVGYLGYVSPNYPIPEIFATPFSMYQINDPGASRMSVSRRRHSFSH